MEKQPLSFGPYSQIEFVDKGSFVTVFRAQHNEYGPVVLRFLYTGARDTLESYIRAAEKARSGGSRPNPAEYISLRDRPADFAEQLSQAETELPVVRELYETLSAQYGRDNNLVVIPQLYPYEKDRLPEVPFVVSEFVALTRIKDVQDAAKAAHFSPLIPEVYALEMTRKFLEALAELHKRKRYLKDAQFGNYRVEFPAEEFPTKPEGLRVKVLDWNGTLEFAQAKDRSPEGFDVWNAFAFLYQLLTGVDLTARDRGVSPDYLRQEAQGHWLNISPGTRELLSRVLGSSRGEERYPLKAAQAIGWLASRLAVWADSDARLTEAITRVMFLDIRPLINDAEWFGQILNNEALLRKVEVLNSQRRTLDVAIKYLNSDDREALGRATDFPQQIPDGALSLDDLRWKMTLTVLREERHDTGSVLNLAQGEDRNRLVQLLAEALTSAKAGDWEALATGQHPLMQLSSPGPRLGDLLMCLGQEAVIRRAWMENSVLQDLAAYPDQMSRLPVESLAKAADDLNGIMDAFDKWYLKEPDKLDANAYRNRIACDLLGVSWALAFDEKPTDGLGKLRQLRDLLDELLKKLKDIYDSYAKLQADIPAQALTENQLLGKVKEIVYRHKGLESHSIHSIRVAGLIKALLDKKDASSIQTAVYFVRRVASVLPKDSGFETIREQVRDYDTAETIANAIINPRREEGVMVPGVEELLDRVKDNPTSLHYLFDRLDRVPIQIRLDPSAANDQLSYDVIAVFVEFVKNNVDKTVAPDQWQRWTQLFDKAVRYQLHAATTYDETKAWVEFAARNHVWDETRGQTLLGELESLHRDYTAFQHAMTTIGKSGQPARDEHEEYNIEWARQEVYKLLNRIDTFQKGPDAIQFGWLKRLEDRLTHEQSVLGGLITKLTGQLDKQVNNAGQALTKTAEALSGTVGDLSFLHQRMEETYGQAHTKLEGVADRLDKQTEMMGAAQGQISDLSANLLVEVDKHVKSQIQSVRRVAVIILVIVIIILIGLGLLVVRNLTEEDTPSVEGQLPVITDQVDDGQVNTQVALALTAIGEAEQPFAPLATATPAPSDTPTAQPTDTLTAVPTVEPTVEPTKEPAIPTVLPIIGITLQPTITPLPPTPLPSPTGISPIGAPVVSIPDLTLAFGSEREIQVGGSFGLTYTLIASQGAEITNYQFEDTLVDPALSFDPESMGPGTCFKDAAEAVSFSADNRTITVSGINLVNGASCTVIVKVKVAAPVVDGKLGVANISNSLQLAQTTKDDLALALSVTMPAPEVSFAFEPAMVYTTNAGSALVVTIRNNAAIELSDVNLDLKQPDGLLYEGTTLTPGEDCLSKEFGFSTTDSGISITGLRLAVKDQPGSNCTVTLPVMGTAAGTVGNLDYSLTYHTGMTQKGQSPANALTVQEPDVAVSKLFASNEVAVGELVRLTYTILNNGAPEMPVTWRLDDTLPDGLVFDALFTDGNQCADSTLVFDPENGAVLTVNGIKLEKGAECAVEVNVEALRAGSYEALGLHVSVPLPGVETVLNPPQVNVDEQAVLTTTITNQAKTALNVNLLAKIPAEVVVDPNSLTVTCGESALTPEWEPSDKGALLRNIPLAPMDEPGAVCTVTLLVAAAQPGDLSFVLSVVVPPDQTGAAEDQVQTGSPTLLNVVAGPVEVGIEPWPLTVEDVNRADWHVLGVDVPAERSMVVRVLACSLVDEECPPVQIFAFNKADTAAVAELNEQVPSNPGLFEVMIDESGIFVAPKSVGGRRDLTLALSSVAAELDGSTARPLIITIEVVPALGVMQGNFLVPDEVRAALPDSGTIANNPLFTQYFGRTTGEDPVLCAVTKPGDKNPGCGDAYNVYAVRYNLDISETTKAVNLLRLDYVLRAGDETLANAPVDVAYYANTDAQGVTVSRTDESASLMWTTGSGAQATTTTTDAQGRLPLEISVVDNRGQTGTGLGEIMLTITRPDGVVDWVRIQPVVQDSSKVTQPSGAFDIGETYTTLFSSDEGQILYIDRNSDGTVSSRAREGRAYLWIPVALLTPKEGEESLKLGGEANLVVVALPDSRYCHLVSCWPGLESEVQTEFYYDVANTLSEVKNPTATVLGFYRVDGVPQFAFVEFNGYFN